MVRTPGINPWTDSQAQTAWTGESLAGPGPSLYFIPLILDVTPPWSASGSGGLLSFPTGLATLLDYLLPQVLPIADGKVLILSESGRQQTADSRIRFVSDPEVAALTQNAEASDYLCIIEPRYWPVDGYDLRWLLRQSAGYCGATHAVAVGSDSESVSECLDYDGAGQVARIPRVYSRKRWGAAASAKTLCSILPARDACGLRLTSLAELRSSLLERDILIQDVPVFCEAEDLSQPEGLLELNEYAVLMAVAGKRPEQFNERSPGVWLHRDASVHTSARLVPPVIVQQGAEVAEGATLLGPLVVGPGAKIGRRASVVRALLTAGAEVAPGAVVLRELGLAKAAERYRSR